MNFEYNEDILVCYVAAWGMLGGQAQRNGDEELIQALRRVSDLIKDRLPIGRSMADILIMSLSDMGTLDAFIEEADKKGLKFTDSAREKRTE